MHKFDGDGALAHGGGNSFDRAVTHIAGHENAGDIRFEQKRITLQSPIPRAAPVRDQIRAGQNEASLVAFDQIGNGARMGIAPMKMKRAIAGTVFTSPVSSLAIVRASRLPLPLASTTRERNCTAIFCVFAI